VEELGWYGSYGLWCVVCSWKAGNDLKTKVWAPAWLVDLPGSPQIGKWYRLGIDAKGSEISYYIDGELEYQRDDSLHPSGGVCLSVFDAIVELDNVVITGDDIPNVGPSGYAVEPEAKLSTTWGSVKR